MRLSCLLFESKLNNYIIDGQNILSNPVLRKY